MSQEYSVAITQAFSFLCYGSAFFHASATDTGMVKRWTLGCVIPRPGFLWQRGEFTQPKVHLFANLCAGGALDVDMISILTYAIHQASIENLMDLGASTVITDLSHTPREMSAADMADSISDMFLTEPPYKWQNHSKSIKTPNYFVTIPSIATTAFSVGFDDSVVDTLAPFLLNLFGIEQEDQDFLLNEYIPEVCTEYFANSDTGYSDNRLQ